MVRASCHCAAVTIEVATAPTELTDCTCSICRRYGVLWAYYPAEDVRIAASMGTDEYRWGAHSLAFHRCRTCGCIAYWSPIDRPSSRMGVNARLMDLAVISSARIRHLDGADTEEYLD